MKKLGTTLAAAGALLALAAPAGAQDRGTVVATNLNNPRQMDVAPDGTIYVAEAGRAGSKCVDGGELGGQTCHGFTSGVTRITTSGKQKRILSGLYSAGAPDGSFTVGLDAVAVSPFGGLVGPVGAAGPLPAGIGPAAALQSGALVRFAPFGTPKAFAALDAYEAANNPDGGFIDSDPYGIEATRDGYFVADAAGNDLLRVDPRTGAISTVAVFPDEDGHEMVPTSVRQGPDGALYVGTLALSADPPFGAAKVFRVVPGEEPTVYADGLTTVVGLDFDDEGNLYVAELFAMAVEKITPEGERTQIGDGETVFPGGVVVGEDGDLYVSNFSTDPAHPSQGPGGQVVRFDLGD